MSKTEGPLTNNGIQSSHQQYHQPYRTNYNNRTQLRMNLHHRENVSSYTINIITTVVILQFLLWFYCFYFLTGIQKMRGWVGGWEV